MNLTFFSVGFFNDDEEHYLMIQYEEEYDEIEQGMNILITLKETTNPTETTAESNKLYLLPRSVGLSLMKKAKNTWIVWNPD